MAYRKVECHFYSQGRLGRGTSLELEEGSGVHGTGCGPRGGLQKAEELKGGDSGGKHWRLLVVTALGAGAGDRTAKALQPAVPGPHVEVCTVSLSACKKVEKGGGELFHSW